MRGEAVHQSPGEPLRAEPIGPLVQGQVGGDQDGAPFLALAEDLEVEFRAGGGAGDEAPFVDDQQPEAGQLPLQIEQSPLVPGLHQFVDHGGRDREAQRHSLLAGSQTQPQGNVGLAGAAVADGDDLFPVLDIFIPGPFHDQGLVHRRNGQEVEGVQGFDAGKTGGTTLVTIRRWTMRWWRSMARMKGWVSGVGWPSATQRVQRRENSSARG